MKCEHKDYRGPSPAMMEDGDYRSVCKNCFARFEPEVVVAPEKVATATSEKVATDCFAKAVYILTGKDTKGLPVPSFTGWPPSWEPTTLLAMLPWLSENSVTLDWDEEWRPGKPCIASFLVLNDPEFVWAHSVVIGPQGKVAMCDPYFAGADIYDLQAMDKDGLIALAEYLYLENLEKRA